MGTARQIGFVTVAVLGCALALCLGVSSPAARAAVSHQTTESGSVPFGGDPLTNRGSVPAGPAVTGAGTTPDARSTIEVDANRPEGTISPEVMGSTFLPPFDGMGSFDPSTDSFWPSFVGALEDQVYAGSIRWPGGILAQYYDFRRAIGPQPQRTDNAFGPSSGPSSSTVGPDEFGELLDRTGAAGISTVNFATGDPQEAEEFVEYMTGAVGSSSWADLRAQNGHPQPYDVPVWEVGNEEYTVASSWRAGAVVTVGGNGACTSDAATCQYIYGGSDSFTSQRVVGYADRSDAAADSTGDPNQSFYVAYPPVQAGSQTVFVGGQAWTGVDSLADSGPDADVYTVDDATGEITFGDGTHGAVAGSGAVVTASYVSGPHSGFVDFYSAMKAANPNIQVCSTDTTDAFVEAMGSSLAYDCLQVHPYVGGDNSSVDISTFERTVMAVPDSESAGVQSWESEIQANAGHSIPVMLTEYGSLIRATPDPSEYPYYSDSLDEALVNASQLADWIKDGIPVADRQTLAAEEPAADSVTVGLPDAAPYAVTGAIVTPGPDTIVEPTGEYFELFKPLARGKLLQTTTLNNPSLTTGGTPIDALSVTAAEDVDGSTGVVVINRDPDNSVTSTLQVDGIVSAGQATVSTLNGASALSYNTASDPDAVTTTTSHATVSNGTVALTFPSHSITLVTVPTASPPRASFTSEQAAGSLAIQFTDASSAVSPATVTGWSWSFGDGVTSTAQSPSHRYGVAGNYPVSLTVTDSNGNQASFEMSVVVRAVAGPSSGSRPPTAGQIKKQLIRALTPIGRHLSIATILSRGSFKTTFAPPEPGKLMVDWYARAGTGRRLILVAAYHGAFSNERKVDITIRLTTRGRKLLHTVTRVVVTGEEAFMHKGKPTVRTSKRFTLVAGSR